MSPTWNRRIRQTHRWLSLTFTVAVVLNLVVRGRNPYALWVGVATLFPLALLLATGLYLFALPYARSARAADAVEDAA
jgi:uncharacterized MAPEG superfamily protein